MKKIEYSLKYLLKADLSRITDNPNIINFFIQLVFPKGSTYPYIVWFRVLQKCKKNMLLKYTMGIFAYVMYLHLTNKYGIHANTNIEVGPGLRIVHRDCVYINCKSIGSNFTIYQGCTLGSRSLSDNTGIPTIGDNVTIYTGAVVSGDISIGSNCIIGANSFVNKSVLNNSFVAGVPARLIKKIGE